MTSLHGCTHSCDASGRETGSRPFKRCCLLISSRQTLGVIVEDFYEAVLEGKRIVVIENSWQRVGQDVKHALEEKERNVSRTNWNAL